MGWIVGDIFPRTLLRGLSAETLNFAAAYSRPLSSSNEQNLRYPWRATSGGTQSYLGGAYRFIAEENWQEDDCNGNLVTRGFTLIYVRPDTSSLNGSFKIRSVPDKSTNSTVKEWAVDYADDWGYIKQDLREEIYDYWETIIGEDEVICDQVNTYLGAKSTCSGCSGGSRCTDLSNGLGAGTTVKVKSGFNSSNYDEQTIPEGIIICPSGVTNCQENEERVLDTTWSPTTGTDGNSIRTNGSWTCVKKSACSDEHNVNYKDPDLYNEDNSLCGDCIDGAQKKWYGVGNGSCMLKIDEWSDSEGKVKLLLGKSGIETKYPYFVIFDNFKGDLSGFQTGSKGFKSYDTEAKARLAFNQAANIRKEEINPSTDDDNDDQDNYQNYIEPTSEGSFPWIPVGLGAVALLLILR